MSKRKPSGHSITKAAKRFFSPAVKLDQLEMFAPNKSKNHGGRREGSGRKKQDMVSIRVPVACLPAIQQLIAEHKNLKTVNKSTQQ